jgi:Fe2+ or Zn2+ uptake regulation protein
MITLSQNEGKVFHAIAKLFEEGNTSITRYQVAQKVDSLDTWTVYRILKQFHKKGLNNVNIS